MAPWRENGVLQAHGPGVAGLGAMAATPPRDHRLLPQRNPSVFGLSPLGGGGSSWGLNGSLPLVLLC